MTLVRYGTRKGVVLGGGTLGRCGTRDVRY